MKEQNVLQERMASERIRGPRKQAGMGLLEAMIWFLLGAIALAGSAGLISKVFGQSDVSKEQQGLVELISSTVQLRSTSGYGTNGTDLVPQLDTINALPTTMSYTGGGLYNAWGGQVTVVSTGIGYKITDQSVPADACIKVAKAISQSGNISTTINSGTAVRGEVTTAQAASACTSDDSNTIEIEVLR